MSVFYIGGARYDGASLWEVTDTGSSISITNSLATTSGNVEAIARAFSGNVYVGLGTAVYKYDSNFLLDTTWASNGIFECGDFVNDLAVDGSEYLAIAHDTFGTNIHLLDPSGVEVWSTAIGTDGEGVSFTNPGDILFAYKVGGVGAKSIALLNRADGTNIETYFVYYNSGQSRKAVSNGLINTKVYGIRDRGAFSAGSVRGYPIDNGNVYDWVRNLGSNNLYDMILHPNGYLYVVGSVGSGSASIWKIDPVDGSIVASYETGSRLHEISAMGYGSSAKLIAVGYSATNEDGQTVNVSVFDTDLVYQYGLNANDGSIIYSVLGAAEIMAVAPIISDQSTGITVDHGTSVSFFITAAGIPDPTYQWYKDSEAISGETSDSIDLGAVEIENAAIYYCVATNVAGSATSNNMVLGINPYLVSQTPDTELDAGTAITLEVVVAGEPATFTYQWSLNSVILAGETSSTYEMASVDSGDMGDYLCAVVETGGTGWSVNVEIELTVITREAGSRLSGVLNAEKNTKRSENPWVLLLEFEFIDRTFYRIAQWKKEVIFEEHEFGPFNFNYDFIEQSSDGSLTCSTLKISNVIFPLEYELQDPDRIIGSTVRFIWVNLEYLEEDYSEMDITFDILFGSYDWKWISLEVGMPNLLIHAFPEGRYLPEGCDNEWKDFDCGYTGLDIVDVDISGAAEVIVEVASHTFVDGDAITLEDINGISALDGDYIATATDSTHISLVGTTATEYSGAYTSGGKISFRYCRKTLSDCRRRQNSNRYMAFIGLGAGTIKLV